MTQKSSPSAAETSTPINNDLFVTSLSAKNEERRQRSQCTLPVLSLMNNKYAPVISFSNSEKNSIKNDDR